MRIQSGHACAAILALMLALSFPRLAGAGEGPLVLGIHPYLSSAELHKRFSPLADILTRELGRPVEIRIENSYQSHIEAIGKGKVDIAFMGPSSYVKLTAISGRVPILAVFETKGSRTFRGIIVVRKDSPISLLTDLKGKRFAFGDVNSTMSHLVPRFMLLKAGIDSRHLSTFEFLTNHDNIAMGVLAGNFDAGALKEDIYEQYAGQGLRALAKSAPMPDHLFVARRGLPEGLSGRVSKVLLSLRETEDGRLALGSIQKNLTALVPARDRDYVPLRRLMDYLARQGVEP